MRVRHEPFEHTADVGFRAFAPTVEELFEECAVAMFTSMFDAPASVPTERVELIAHGDNFPDLLVAWLSELLWLAESRHLALSQFRVDAITMNEVRGTASGSTLEGVDLVGSPVKAVTYHGLDIRNDNGWRATVVLDV